MGYSLKIQECEDCQRLIAKHKSLNECENCGHLYEGESCSCEVN